MPAQARNQVVRNGEIAVYHCWSRCVQRAFLCGQDSYTGDDYDYRRDWIEKLLEYQAGVFAVDVGNHSVLSNHLHLVARTRPDIAAGWSDEEVACRWKLAWPEWQPDLQRWVREPTSVERLSPIAPCVTQTTGANEPDWGQSGYTGSNATDAGKSWMSRHC
ncbi:MAG: hypothetical protein J5I93_06675 [Pirellulaceae bacterium]|nr:hypothetical protein [Pirellulaceae bacterium]